MRTTAMRLLVILVAACVLTSSASEGVYLPRRTLAKSASSVSSAEAVATDEGSASASAAAESFGGRAFADAFASSEVEESSKNIVANSTTRILSNADIENCTDFLRTAEAEVRNEGSAIAAVYVDAFGTVEIDGDGQACINSTAAGDAVASSFAQATAEAIIEAAGDNAKSGAEAIASATAAATAEAWANAFVSACSEGGFGEVEQSTFAEAIVRPLVEVFAFALVGEECQDEARKAAEAIAEVEGESRVDETENAESTSNVNVQGETQGTAEGDAGAGTTVAETAEDQEAIIDGSD